MKKNINTAAFPSSRTRYTTWITLVLVVLCSTSCRILAFEEEMRFRRPSLSMDDLRRIISSELHNELYPEDSNDEATKSIIMEEKLQRASAVEWARARQQEPELMPSGPAHSSSNYLGGANKKKTKKSRKSLRDNTSSSRDLRGAETDYDEFEEDTTTGYDSSFDVGPINNDRTSLMGDALPTTMHPYIVCVEKHDDFSGTACYDVVANTFGRENVEPLYNNEDMGCFQVSAEADLAYEHSGNNNNNNLHDHHMIVQPLLPDMKIAVDTLQNLEAGYSVKIEDKEEIPPYTQFQAFLCPGSSGVNSDSDNGSDLKSQNLSSEMLEAIGHSSTTNAVGHGHKNRRSLLAAEFLRDEESRAEHRHSRWARHLETSADHSCQEIFDTHVNATMSHKHEFLTFTVNKNDDDDESSMANDAFHSCSVSLLAGLSLRPEVCSVQVLPPPVLRNVEAQWIVQGGSDSSDRPFFDAGITGTGQIVSVSDSGLDTDNCYFWDSSGDINKDGVIDLSRRKVAQYVAYADGQASFGDHGTHTAGSIAGRRAINGDSNDETDGAADGIARDAKISFFDIGRVSNPLFLATPVDSTDIFKASYNANKKKRSYVHSASWGVEFNGYGLQEREFDGWSHENDDYVIVVAAGNSGANRFASDIANTVGSPATAKNIIAVGATQSAGTDLESGMLGRDYVADFSSRGPTRDNRLKPDILAPGFFILSANADPNKVGECDADGGNGLMYQAGTSMSAPIVAGTVALIRQYLVEGYYPLGRKVVENIITRPSGSLIKAILMNGGRAMAGVQNMRTITQSAPYDNTQGFGRVSLLDSLPLEGKNDLRMRIFDRKTLNDGKKHVYDFIIDTTSCDVTELSITLVWADPPALPNCQRCMLNDLDLLVQKGDVVYFPNGGQQRDNMNNAERVRINHVENGSSYKVTVRAFDLETESQDYALVVTGCLAEEDDGTTSSPTASSPPTSEPSTGAPTVSPPPSLSPTIPMTDSLTYVETTFEGEYVQAGNMFNVRAERDIVVRAMDIHTTSVTDVGVQVWIRNESYRYQEYRNWGWIKVVDTTVRGMGYGVPTHIPEEAFTDPILLAQFKVMGLYITCTTTAMVYSVGESDGRPYYCGTDLCIGEGAAKTYPFGRSYKPRVWNGSFYYDVL